MNNMEEYSITNYYVRSKLYDILTIDNKFSRSQLTYIEGNFTTPYAIPPTKSFIIGEKRKKQIGALLKQSDIVFVNSIY